MANSYKIHSEFRDENKFHIKFFVFQFAITLFQLITVALGVFLWFVIAKPFWGIAGNYIFVTITLLIVLFVACIAFVSFPVTEPSKPAGCNLIVLPLRIINHKRKHKKLFVRFLDRSKDH